MKAEANMICGIDTMALSSTTFLPYSPPYFTHDQARMVRGGQLGNTYTYRFNPSLLIDNGMYSLSSCLKALEYVIEDTNLPDVNITRIDFCFDDFYNEYRDLYKLYHLLFYLLAKAFKIKNDYSSCGIVSPVLKTLRIQNTKGEAEFYNKAIEEPDGIIKCRLEARSKKVNISAKNADKIVNYLVVWLNALHKMTKLKNDDLDIYLNDLNEEIMKHYEADVARDEYDEMDYNSMIQRYHRYIFTRRQLGELIRRMGFRAYDSIASKYKWSHPGLEFYQIGDLRKNVKHLNEAASRFLTS